VTYAADPCLLFTVCPTPHPSPPPPGDYSIASDRLKRYLAIGASLATARAHKVRGFRPTGPYHKEP